MEQDPDGQPTPFGEVERDLIYGENGWCVAEHPGWSCPCLIDGVGGPLCDQAFEPFCPNQCNGARQRAGELAAQNSQLTCQRAAQHAVVAL